jgi:hypothetical protein
LVDESLWPAAPCPARLASRGAAKAIREVVSAVSTMVFLVAAATRKMLVHSPLLVESQKGKQLSHLDIQRGARATGELM